MEFHDPSVDIAMEHTISKIYGEYHRHDLMKEANVYELFS